MKKIILYENISKTKIFFLKLKTKENFKKTIEKKNDAINKKKVIINAKSFLFNMLFVI